MVYHAYRSTRKRLKSQRIFFKILVNRAQQERRTHPEICMCVVFLSYFMPTAVPPIKARRVLHLFRVFFLRWFIAFYSTCICTRIQYQSRFILIWFCAPTSMLCSNAIATSVQLSLSLVHNEIETCVYSRAKLSTYIKLSTATTITCTSKFDIFE